MKKVLFFLMGLLLLSLFSGCEIEERDPDPDRKPGPVEPDPDSGLLPVILDFSTRDGDGMIVTYRVGSEDQVTETIEERYHRYVTEAAEDCTVFARVQSIPDGKKVELTISVNGKLIAGGSREDGEIIESARVYDRESPSTHEVVLDFVTGGTGMIVTYRVGTEDQVRKTVEGTYYNYSTTAALYSSVLTRVQAIPESGDCGVSITADGLSMGGSHGYPGEVVRQVWIFFD